VAVAVTALLAGIADASAADGPTGFAPSHAEIMQVAHDRGLLSPEETPQNAAGAPTASSTSTRFETRYAVIAGLLALAGLVLVDGALRARRR
jgi:hypothetical protein